MFTKLLVAFSPLFILMIPGCQPAVDFPPDYKGDQLHFGQGGGFSGILQYYVLLDDGRLFQKGFRDSVFAKSDTWEKPFVRQIFKSYSMLELEHIRHYEPGDLYYFIEYRTRRKPPHRIAWGRPGHQPDEKIVAFYNLLFKSTKSKS